MKTSTILIILINIAVMIIFIFLDKYLFFDVTKRGWHKADRELPELASRMELKFKQAEVDYEIGEISGIYRDRNIKVQPDRHAYIEVGFHQPHIIETSTKKSQLRNPPTGMVDFSSGNKKFDDLFQSRFASHEISQKLIQSADKLDFAGQFRRTWMRKLKYLEVTERGVGCSVKYGLSSYIPADVLEELLPDLSRLADMLESVIEETDSQPEKKE